MRPLTSLLLFALGMHLSLRSVAALYRIIDLWYTIGTAYPAVLRGVIGWGGGTLAVAVALPDGLRPAFLLGLVSFPGFYLVLQLLLPVLVRRREALTRPPGATGAPGRNP